jgi:hypothetical protein
MEEWDLVEERGHDGGDVGIRKKKTYHDLLSFVGPFPLHLVAGIGAVIGMIKPQLGFP